MCVVEVKQSVAHRVEERVVDRAATFVPDSALVKGDGIRVNGGGGAAREESAEDEEEREGERSEESGSDGEEKIEGFHFFFYLQYRFLFFFDFLFVNGMVVYFETPFWVC